MSGDERVHIANKRSHPASKPDFADAVRKVERARAHIFKLDTEATRFFSRHPFDVSMTPFKRRGRFVFGVGERKGFPDRLFSLIIGDAVHNLRSALDYLIAACATARGCPIDKTEFPVQPYKWGVEKIIQRKVGPAGPTARRLVMESRPYRRGNRYLHAVHELDRSDKHRLVVPVGCMTKVSVTSGGWNDLPHVTHETTVVGRRGRVIPVQPGYENAIMTEAQFVAEIIFGKDTPVAGEACYEALRKMYLAVTDVIARFETTYGTIRFSSSLLANAPSEVPIGR
jgi:hypothetical protein